MAIARTSPSPTVATLTGDDIRLRRLALRLTQTAFIHYYNATLPEGTARLSGPLLSHIETGIVTPGPDLAARLSRVLEALEGGAQ